MRFQVLGPVAAYDGGGGQLNLGGPRHREVLARLIVARGQVVPVSSFVEDLWAGGPPRRAVGSVRTFVSALRAALGAGQPIVTAGPGYAFRGTAESVDAWRFEAVVARPDPGIDLLEEAVGWWHGPAYADFPDATWARAERGRLTELRLGAVEQLARARLAAGRPEAAVPDLDAHVTDHPWREEGGGSSRSRCTAASAPGTRSPSCAAPAAGSSRSSAPTRARGSPPWRPTCCGAPPGCAPTVRTRCGRTRRRSGSAAR